MLLSYSTLNNLRNCRYTWVCKQQGLETVDFSYFEKGKKIHRQIQDHVSGRVIDKELTSRGLDPNKWYFPIVEEVDRDENCHFEIDVDGHKLHGYVDGKNPGKSFLEIKTGNYTPRDFKKSYQRKIYALATGYPLSILINAKDEFSKVTTAIIPNTEKDKQEALEWVREGIKIIESGDYEGGENINCHRCIYRDTCERSVCNENKNQ